MCSMHLCFHVFHSGTCRPNPQLHCKAHRMMIQNLYAGITSVSAYRGPNQGVHSLDLEALQAKKNCCGPHHTLYDQRSPAGSKCRAAVSAPPLCNQDAGKYGAVVACCSDFEEEPPIISTFAEALYPHAVVLRSSHIPAHLTSDQPQINT